MSDRLPKGVQRTMAAEHYFTPEPGAAELAGTVEFSAGGRNLTLRTSSGVFSGQRLDPGTAVLLRKAPLPGPRGGGYLDLGWRSGPMSPGLAGTSETARGDAVEVEARPRRRARPN